MIWPTHPIQEAVECLIDYRGKTPKKTSSGIRLITAKVIKGGRILEEPAEYIAEDEYDTWMRRGLPKQWDVLITTEAPLGELGILRSTEKIALAQRVILLRGKPDLLDQKFLFYVMQGDFVQHQLRARATGATVLGIKQSELRQVEVPSPSLDVQRQVASILSTYDDLIMNNTRRIEILEEMARRLYEEWFVHFRFSGHEEASFKESELGRIPEGWKPVAFSEVASFMNGFAFKPSHFTDDGLPVIKIKELKSGITADTPRCSGEIKEKYLVKDGDILFSWSAHLDAYIWKGGEGWLNQHLFKVDGVDGIPKSFLYFSLKDKMGEFRAKSMGTTMQHIKRSALNEVRFPMPSESLTSQFDDLVTPILNEVLLLQRKNTNLRAQRDLLLPKLVSGEIDVSDIPMPDDKEVEAA